MLVSKKRIAAAVLGGLFGWVHAGYGQGPQSLNPSPRPQEELPTTRTAPGASTPQAPSSGTPRLVSRGSGGGSRNAASRVARAPNMFGDTLNPLVSFQGFRDASKEGASLFTAPLGGAGSFNAAENNTAVPTDRVYLAYNVFFNATSTTVGFDQNFVPIQKSSDLHRYLIGFEKTFLDGNLSVDVRMPLLSSFRLDSLGLSSDLGNVGSLTIYNKVLLFRDEDTAVATGLGVSLPTASDVTTGFSGSELLVKNHAIHLMPFIAATKNINDLWFMQSFTQMNFAASGNDVLGPSGLIGVYNEQNLFQVDMGLGRWLWQDRLRPVVTGLAGVAELHYTTTVQDTDSISNPFNPNASILANGANRIDLLNLTTGLQAQLGPQSNLRIGTVVPLRNQPDRVFDSELQVSFNRRF